MPRIPDDDEQRLRAEHIKAWVEAKLAEAHDLTPQQWDRLAELIREFDEDT